MFYQKPRGNRPLKIQKMPFGYGNIALTKFLPAKSSPSFAASSSYQSCRSQKPDYPFSSNLVDRTKESPRIRLQIAARRLLIMLLSVHVYRGRLNIQNWLRNYSDTGFLKLEMNTKQTNNQKSKTKNLGITCRNEDFSYLAITF